MNKKEIRTLLKAYLEKVKAAGGWDELLKPKGKVKKVYKAVSDLEDLIYLKCGFPRFYDTGSLVFNLSLSKKPAARIEITITNLEKRLLIYKADKKLGVYGLLAKAKESKMTHRKVFPCLGVPPAMYTLFLYYGKYLTDEIGATKFIRICRGFDKDYAMFMNSIKIWNKSLERKMTDKKLERITNGILFGKEYVGYWRAKGMTALA